MFVASHHAVTASMPCDATASFPTTSQHPSSQELFYCLFLHTIPSHYPCFAMPQHASRQCHNIHPAWSVFLLFVSPHHSVAGSMPCNVTEAFPTVSQHPSRLELFYCLFLHTIPLQHRCFAMSQHTSRQCHNTRPVQGCFIVFY